MSEHAIAAQLGFTHGLDASGDPCVHDDSALLFCEQYIGNETRRINGLAVVSREGRLTSVLTLDPDALSDEPQQTIKQEVECRYCDGVPASPAGVLIEFDYA